MDPTAMINDASFPTGTAPNTAPFHFPEIWHFPPPPFDSSSSAAGVLGLRTPQFGHGGHLRDFASCPTRDVPGNNPVGSEHGSGPNHNNINRKRCDSEEEESTKVVSTSNNGGDNANANANGVSDGGEGKRVKGSSRNRNENVKGEGGEHSSGKLAEKQNNEPPKQDYIHVRARRGQATDSHSLAERARREKISERMKILQDLVPGCSKVIGKALVLDEIINYIQSLQRQVEFLSMKLEAVNSRLTPGIEVFPPKDFDQQTFDTASMPFASQTPRDYSRGSSPEWLHMQVGGGFERTT